jgi:hypothetical protein
MTNPNKKLLAVTDLLLLLHWEQLRSVRTSFRTAIGKLDKRTPSRIVMAYLLACPHYGKTVALLTRDKVDMQVKY